MVAQAITKFVDDADWQAFSEGSSLQRIYRNASGGEADPWAARARCEPHRSYFVWDPGALRLHLHLNLHLCQRLYLRLIYTCTCIYICTYSYQKTDRMYSDGIAVQLARKATTVGTPFKHVPFVAAARSPQLSILRASADDDLNASPISQCKTFSFFSHRRSIGAL